MTSMDRNVRTDVIHINQSTAIIFTSILVCDRRADKVFASHVCTSHAQNGTLGASLRDCELVDEACERNWPVQCRGHLVAEHESRVEILENHLRNWKLEIGFFFSSALSHEECSPACRMRSSPEACCHCRVPDEARRGPCRG